MADLRTNYSTTSPAGDLPHGDVNDAFGRINALKAKLDGLPASAATPASVTAAVAAIKAEILGGAGPAYDTLQELLTLIDADDDANDNAAAALTTLVGTKLGLVQAAKVPESLVTGNIVRDSNDLVTSAAVVWPDGTVGTLTITSRDSNGAVLTYNITYGSPVTKTFTQPAISVNANGAATSVPAIVVS